MPHYPNRWGYRRPHTTQERRENDAIRYEEVEFRLIIRPSRTERVLPSEHHELPKADRKNRNWKKNRRQRYRRATT